MLLEEDAFWLLKGAPRPFVLPWFPLVFNAWRDWQRGVPPSRAWLGRAGQNPHLLEAFSALNRAERRANTKS